MKWTDIGLCNSRIWKHSHGRGAGYIGGWTIFFAINCNDKSKGRPSRFFTCHIGRFYFGWTVNANVVPYCIH
jgi:hypothetical protein